jgi:uncharacterized protein (DUF1778 family)
MPRPSLNSEKSAGDTKITPVRISKEDLGKIESAAQRLEVNRSEFIRRSAVEAAEIILKKGKSKL